MHLYLFSSFCREEALELVKEVSVHDEDYEQVAAGFNFQSDVFGDDHSPEEQPTDGATKAPNKRKAAGAQGAPLPKRTKEARFRIQCFKAASHICISVEFMICIFAYLYICIFAYLHM